MQKSKLGVNFGFRGWMLLLAEATAFLMFQAFSNFPMNMIADFYGGAQLLSTMYTIATLVGIVIQLVLSTFIGKVKNIKVLTLIMGCITLLAAVGIMTIPPGGIWKVAYFVFNVFSIIYAMFSLGILIGQWFPTRKGVFMGIATFAFPICNGLMGPFSGWVNIGAGYGVAMAPLEQGGYPDFEAGFHALNVAGAFLPFLIAGLAGWLLILIFLKDYPEQVGAYRDNNKDLTPEIANAMMLQEIENKKTTVWKTGTTLSTAQFWLITIPMGALLMCSVGMMTQTASIIGAYFTGDAYDQAFGTIMGLVMVCALIGSYILGLIDTAFGSKRAVTLSVIIMLLSGILGGIGQLYTTVAAIVLLAIFMGAASNFTVSAAAQYWRREDFPSVFACVNPFANVIQALGPFMVAMTMGIGGVTMPFWAVAIVAVISLILVVLFQPAKVKEADDAYRKAAGKPLDDALVGRK